ncbi:translation elongation factor Ts [Patescibacteria group bacterium]|nr:translation elongation factor Ts [Patescibacteria group bacterium]MBU2633308.1 translation elongation factor Ts [Patescibacteria group bacterium]
MTTADEIKKLREQTGVSIMLCKKALEFSDGDEGRAMEWLRQNGADVAHKKSSRSAKSGIVESYIHNNGQVGVLVEVRSETDFVAKNPDFKNFAHNIAMHIAASDPEDKDVLLEEEYVKNPNIKVSDYINESIQKFGENIEIMRFQRFSL